MFGRRTRLSFHRRLWRILWPKGGWWRFSSYLAHRIRRLPGTPESIAAGVASGVAVSFTPFMGLHFLLACGLAYLLRGNLIAAAVGTVVGNPWTFPMIWAWIYALGRWLLGDVGTFHLPTEVTFEDMASNPLLIIWPMTVGGVPMATTAFFATYYPVKRMVATYQAARIRRLRRRTEAAPTAEEGRAGFKAHRVRAAGMGTGAACRPTARNRKQQRAAGDDLGSAAS